MLAGGTSALLIDFENGQMSCNFLLTYLVSYLLPTNLLVYLPTYIPT